MHTSNIRFFSVSLILAAIAFGPAACESDSGDSSDEVGDGDGDTGDGDTGGGTTPCGTFGAQEIDCQAGQYCADPALSLCENGCLSNDNCAADQTCEKPSGEDVGTCQNNAPAGPTEQEFCDKLLVCDPSGTMAECSMAYAGTSEKCHQCVVDGNCGDINDGACDTDCGL